MNESSPPDRRFTAPLRWLGAAIAVLYGFAKLNGSQFTILDSELTRPMGEVSGFWLTWYYFGYSSAYGTIIALSQIIGGLLLIWPATSLFGALLLLPIVANIIFADIFFGIGALPMSLLLMACLLVTLAPDLSRLVRSAWIPGKSNRVIRGARIVGAVVLLGVAHLFTQYIANENNRSPTPIDGEWAAVNSAEVETVFFEYNRAFMAIFRSADFSDRTHHFEVEGGTVRVWEDWLAKGRLLFEGAVLDSTRIRLVSVNDPGESLELLRVRAPGAAR